MMRNKIDEPAYIKFEVDAHDNVYLLNKELIRSSYDTEASNYDNTYIIPAVFDPTAYRCAMTYNIYVILKIDSTTAATLVLDGTLRNQSDSLTFVKRTSSFRTKSDEHILNIRDFNDLLQDVGKMVETRRV